MLRGCVAGVLYAMWGFGGVGESPTICFTGGPFRNGMLHVGGYHIHHWVVYSVLGAIGVVVRWYNAAGFCAVMTLHGLSYADAFCFRAIGEEEDVEEDVDGP